ncbi:hypothetical protein [Hominenteromicrobium sp.]|uniref:hypothetical protein n=1 Tax=Hominenteromicrobium sp. TaxID=3073581 RepID=UPI00399B9871
MSHRGFPRTPTSRQIGGTDGDAALTRQTRANSGGEEAEARSSAPTTRCWSLRRWARRC